MPIVGDFNSRGDRWYYIRTIALAVSPCSRESPTLPLKDDSCYQMFLETCSHLDFAIYVGDRNTQRNAVFEHHLLHILSLSSAQPPRILHFQRFFSEVSN